MIVLFLLVPRRRTSYRLLGSVLFVVFLLVLVWHEEAKDGGDEAEDGGEEARHESQHKHDTGSYEEHKISGCQDDVDGASDARHEHLAERVQDGVDESEANRK